MAIDKLKNYGGFAALAIGGIMFFLGGYNIMKNTKVWGHRLADRVESYSSVSESKEEITQPNKEAKDEMNYIFLNLALLGLGAGLGGLGTVLALTREHEDYKSRDTKYSSFSDYRHESQVKGSKEDPWEIG